MLRPVVLVVIVAAIVATCDRPATTGSSGPLAIAVWTMEPDDAATPPGCPAALIEGTLVEDAQSGVGIQIDEGAYPVVWPHGFTARDGDPVALIDADGQVVARVGDHIRMGGGFVARGGGFLACGGITAWRHDGGDSGKTHREMRWRVLTAASALPT